MSEIYGPVCQGEGALIGQQTIFVRLGGCDFRCSWCDSKYAVEAQYAKEWAKRYVEDITREVCNLWWHGNPNNEVSKPQFREDLPHVTLSGGNPAIHNLVPLLKAFEVRGVRAAIETQGSTEPNLAVVKALDHVTLSPKPPSAQNQHRGQRMDGAQWAASDSNLRKWIDMANFAGTPVCLKVVVFDDEDYQYLRMVHFTYPGILTFAQAGTNVGVASRDDLCDALLRLQDRILGDPDMRAVRPLAQLHAVLKGHARGI